MGSVYKALMRASEEREALKRKPPPPPPPTMGEDAGDQVDPSVMEEEMLVLLESIESLLFRRRRKIIQFVGSQEGERASNIARAYAKTSASVIGLSVLLMEPAHCDSSLAHALSQELKAPSMGGSRDPELLESVFRKVGETGLFVSAPANAALCNAGISNSDSNQLLWALLRERFDLIVVDSGPLSKFDGPPGRVTWAYGVVLVFESEMPALANSGMVEDVGLASILDVVAQGGLSPVEVVTCLGAPLLLLTPTEQAVSG